MWLCCKYYINILSGLVHHLKNKKQTGLKCVTIAGHVQVGYGIDYVKEVQKYHQIQILCCLSGALGGYVCVFS
jgi:hypothetical protein